MIGGSGIDIADYSARLGSVTVDLTTPGGDGEAGEGDDVQENVETILGGSAGDALTGGASANTLIGAAGADSLIGGSGFDRLDGGAGDDSLDGGADPDVLVGGSGSDGLHGSEGNDLLSGQSGNDALDGGEGADTLDGGSDTDTAVYSSRVAKLWLSVDGGPDDGETGEGDNIRTDVENVVAGSGPDALVGGDGSNSLDAGAGNDAVNTVDGVVDNVTCGSGTDSVDADDQDRVARDCEKVTRWAAAVRILTSSVTASRRGVVSLSLRCTGKKPCAGTISLESSRRKSKRQKKSRGAALGTSRFTIAAGKRKTVKVRLSKSASRRLRRSRRLATKASASLQGQAVAARASKRLVIKAAKRKRGGKR
jgi:Ca2+-binding RTX toxin-like protein